MADGRLNIKNERTCVSRILESAGLNVDVSNERGCPQQGPRILFFSGGSALRDFASELTEHTLNSVHVVSTFDSGGSTGELRRAFSMPAPGDLRLRMVSLADYESRAVAAAARFFETRLEQASPTALLKELHGLADGLHPMVSELSEQCRLAFQGALQSFLKLMPQDFKLDGAALGNLVLAGDYLTEGRSLQGSVSKFAALLHDRGLVLPVSEDPVHLAVRLENDEIVAGQHRFTGKWDEGALLPAPIMEMFFCEHPYLPCPVNPVSPVCGPEVARRIESSDLICYPVGSFYSSVLSNLKVAGVGEAILRNSACKVYVPNPGQDPESGGLTLEQQLKALCRAVAGCEEATGVLDYLLVDRTGGDYAGGVPDDWCLEQGVKIIDYCYVDNSCGLQCVHAERLALFLFMLAGTQS